jgi:hypothetical protein
MNDYPLAYKQSAQHTKRLLEHLDQRQAVSEPVLHAALALPVPADRQQLLDATRRFFLVKCITILQGLEQLPSPWLE